MDHLSRWINKTRQEQQKKKAALKKVKEARGRPPTGAKDDINPMALVQVEGVLQDIPQILIAQAALTCKAYARSLLNFESRIVAQRSHKTDKDLQEYYENLHECYADLDEPDGMEGISTKIVAPSVWHQIREHESTGRWTSAQSCWEVKLQQTPEDPACHIGLLRCLRNLGHYGSSAHSFSIRKIDPSFSDSMRTHIVGILHGAKENADWDRILAPFIIEASLIVSDWDAVEEALRIPDIDGPEVAFGTIVTAMRQSVGEQLSKAFYDAREQLGGPIVAAGKESYRQVYDSVINLHVLHELETIKSRPGGSSRSELTSALKTRLDSTSPSFRAREPILNMRRTALSLQSVPLHECETELTDSPAGSRLVLDSKLESFGSKLRKSLERPDMRKPRTARFCKPTTSTRHSSSSRAPNYSSAAIKCTRRFKKSTTDCRISSRRLSSDLPTWAQR